MRIPPIRKAPSILPLFCISLMVACSSTHGHEGHHPTVASEMRQAAVEFMASLDDDLRKQLTFDFDGKQRSDWHFIPKERVGVALKEMSLPQRRAARTLMRSVLSDKGYLKATTIMSLEQVLRLLEADRENVNQIRDQEKYWFAVFGDPAGGKPWGWRVEGHHLSLNFTSTGKLIVGTAPIFFGANPAEVRVGPRLGLRVLGSEEDSARELMASFTESQQKQAIISTEAPNDVLTLPGEPTDLGKPVGLAAIDMTDRQQTMLRQMVVSFLSHLEPTLAKRELRKIENAGYGHLYFAWAGGLGMEENHYYRIHGPTFVLEYDNAQGNHAHVVWHSKDNDFGADVLRRHYEQHQHTHAE